MVGSIWVLGINPADSHEFIRIGLHDMGRVSIVPAIKNHLHQNRSLDPIGRHEGEEVFRVR